MPLLLALLACATPKATPDAPAAEAPAVTEAAADAAERVHYGEPFTVEAVTPAADLLADPAAYVGQTVRVEGRVAEVCQKAGCWMVIAEGDATMRVLMKDHAFAVDKQGSGRDCQVEGLVSVRELDPEWVEHLASESESPEAMPEKQAVDNKVYELVASGVSMAAR